MSTAAAELIQATSWTVAAWLICLCVVLIVAWRASSSPYSKPGNQPIPALHKLDHLGCLRRMKWINAVPGFLRRYAAQILVREKRVVPTAPITEFLV
jgi:hypothetical protein